MSKTRALRVVLVVVMLVGALGAAGPGTTIAYFSDSHDGTGSISADVGYSTNPGNGNGGGNNDPGPNGPKAYNDENNNGEYDNGEETINRNKIADFNDQSANLVIPSDVGSVNPNNQQVAITAASITSEVEIRSETGQVTLDARDGDVELAGTNVTGENGKVDIRAPNGHVNVDDATITSDTGSVLIEAQSISAEGAAIDSNGKVDLVTTRNGGGPLDAPGITVESTGAFVVEAGGDVTLDESSIEPDANVQISAPERVDISSSTIDAPTGSIDVNAQSIDASEAVLSSQNNDIALNADRNGGDTIAASGVQIDTATGDIQFISNGDVTLDDASISAQNRAITADLGTSTAVLSVGGSVIDDQDDTLSYDPDDIDVIGTPDSGATSP